MSDAASDPSATSQRLFKLCRGIRIFASNYLQGNLLTLPSLPTLQKLAEIRENNEREARERLREIEKQRQLQRQKELSRGPAHANVGTTITEEQKNFDDDDRGFAGASTSGFSADHVQGEKRNRFEKLKNFSNKVIPKVHFRREGGGSARVERLNSGSGWMGNTEVVGSVDSQDDPFSLQQQQLVGFIQQARTAGRMDEVAALEESLCEIESLMSERAPQSLMAYGFD